VSANKKLDRYLGKLSPKQVAQGIYSANANAKRLLIDAEILCQNGRYPSAVGVAILAIEEAGKEPVLRSLALARNNEDLKISWKDYRTHTEKNRLVALPNLLSTGARKLEEFRPLFTESEYPQLIENLKQISFYTDCLGKAHWSCPAEVIDEKQAKQIIAFTKIVVEVKHDVTEKEIELFLKHIGPVWKKDIELMKTALKNYFRELHSIGLLKGSIENAMSFVDGNKEWVH